MATTITLNRDDVMQAEHDPVAPPVADTSIATLLSDLRDDAIAYTRAQADLWKVIAAETSRTLAIWIAIIALAAVLAFAALSAALFGLIQILAVTIGMGWAVLTITLIALLLAFGLGWLAIRRISGAFSKSKP